MQIFLAQPRGFCAGVVRAIDIVELALEVYQPPVYVFHEIVHNRHVVENLRQRGAVFIEAIADVPDGAVCIFSAHGVATKIVAQAEARGLNIIDATCPLVTKVHLQAQRYQQQGLELLIIGHAGHPEVEGTRGRVREPVQVLCSVAEVEALQVRDPAKLAYVTQTTLSVDDTQDVIARLKQRFPHIQGPALNDICYATQSRQNAVRALAEKVDVLLVVGAQNSSNSNRLRELGEQIGIPSYLIEDADAIAPAWLPEQAKVGITAGASAPEVLVQGVIDRLRAVGVKHIETLPGEPETTSFKLPKVLQAQQRARAART